MIGKYQLITVLFLCLGAPAIGANNSNHSNHKLEILTLPPKDLTQSKIEQTALPNFQNPLNIISEAEKKSGRLFFISVQRLFALNSDLVIQQYIHDLGNLLVNYANIINPHSIFFIVDEPSINAFAGPAGYIGIHSGLLLKASSEGMLASVLAHEIAHYKQRHLHRLIDKQYDGYANPLLIAGLLLAGIVTNSPQVLPGVLTLQGKQIEDNLKFLRQFENEADAVGLKILQDAGFSGQYSVEFMQRLAENDFSSDSTEYLRTHPLTRKRIANLQNQISDKTLYAPKSEFDLIQARLAYLSELPMEQGLSDYQQKYVNFLMFLEKNEHQKAHDLWSKLPAPIKVNSLLFNCLYMQLLLDSNRFELAEKQLDKLIQFYPNHLKVLELKAQFYSKNNNNSAAINAILEHTDDQFYDLYQAHLWRILSDLYFKKEEKANYLHAKAQEQYYLGFLRKALEYLDNAIKSTEEVALSEKNKLEILYNSWYKKLYTGTKQPLPSPYE